MNRGIKLIFLCAFSISVTACGSKTSLAEKACDIYKSGTREELISAFAELARENPNYKDVYEEAKNVASEMEAFNSEDMDSFRKFDYAYNPSLRGTLSELDSFCA